MTVGRALVRSRFRGALVGVAAGDALGAPVEFLSRSQILKRFGPRGLDHFAAWANDAGLKMPGGSITDDTQLTLATGWGLLDAARQSHASGVWHLSDFVWPRYAEWLKSQEDPRRRRFPGNTCLSAIGGGEAGDIDDPINDSKGTGGVMRVAPVGLAFRPVQAFEHAAEVAALTHGHPSGFLAAGFLADVISRLARGEAESRAWTSRRGGQLPGAIAETREVLLGYDDYDEVLGSVDTAVELYMSDADLDEAHEALGEGWVADEALGIALFSALNFPEDFAEGVLAAVNITGDSDTTGSMTGAVLGAFLGLDSIPGDWVRAVEHREALLEMADSLFAEFISAVVE